MSDAKQERTLIACALLDVEAARRLTALAVPVMFADPHRARCWAAIGRVATCGTGPLAMIDAVALELDRDGPDRVALRDCAGLMPRARNLNAPYFARLVAAAYNRRVWRRRWRAAAIICAAVYAPVLALTFAARWDENLLRVISGPFGGGVVLMVITGAVMFVSGETEDNGRRMLAGAALALVSLALAPLAWWWLWRCC